MITTPHKLISVAETSKVSAPDNIVLDFAKIMLTIILDFTKIHL